jgi:hypothetical protein
VKVNVSPWVKEGQATLSMEKTVQAVKDILRSHFDGSAWKAGMAQRDYEAWAVNSEVHGEETGRSLPMSDGARSWKAFHDRVEVERLRSAAKGQHWRDVNIDEDISFSEVMNFRATVRPRPRQRM